MARKTETPTTARRRAKASPTRRPAGGARLSHLDEQGRASMVDVSAKAVTARRATAKGAVTMQPETLALIAEAGLAKGDVLSVAQLAGVMGAKRTADLIPLCHPLPLDNVQVTLACLPERSCVEITATAQAQGRTGVEMEAMTAVAVAALTIYDMCKSVDRGMRLTEIHLVEKTGGKSGTYRSSS